MAESASHVISIDFELTADRARESAERFRQEQESKPIQLRTEVSGGQPPNRPPTAIAAAAPSPPPPPPEPSRTPITTGTPQQQLAATFQQTLNDAAARNDRNAVARLMDQARQLGVNVNEPRDARTYQRQIDYGAAAYTRNVGLAELQTEGVRRRDFDELTARRRAVAPGLTREGEAEVERFTPKSDKLESAVDQLVNSITAHAKAEDQAAKASEQAARAQAGEQRAIQSARLRFATPAERPALLRQRIEAAPPGSAEEFEARQQQAQAYVDQGPQRRQTNQFDRIARRLLIYGGAREVIGDYAAQVRAERQIASTPDLERQLQIATAAADRASSGFIGGTLRSVSGLVQPIFDPNASRLQQGIGAASLAGASVGAGVIGASTLSTAGAGGTGAVIGGVALTAATATALAVVSKFSDATDKAIEEANKRTELDKRSDVLQQRSIENRRGTELLALPDVERQRRQIEFEQADAVRAAQRERTFASGQGESGRGLTAAANDFEQAANELARAQLQAVNRQESVRNQTRDVETTRLEDVARGGSERAAGLRAARSQFDVRFSDAFNKGEDRDELNRMVREFEAQDAAARAQLNKLTSASDIATNAAGQANRLRTARDPISARIQEVTGEAFAQSTIADAADRGRILRKGMSDLFGFLGQTGNALSDAAKDTENQRRVSRLQRLGFTLESQTQAIEASREQQQRALPRVGGVLGRLLGVDALRTNIDANADEAKAAARQQEQQRRTLQRGENAALTSALNRDPLQAQIDRIDAESRAQLTGRSPFAPGTLDLIQNRLLREATARRQFADQRTNIDLQQSGGREQLELLLQRKPYEAETRGIVNRTRLEERQLRQQGLAPEADEARKQGILQIQLQRREFLEGFAPAGIDPRFANIGNPRDVENPQSILDAMGKAERELNKNGGGAGGVDLRPLLQAVGELPRQIGDVVRDVLAN